MEDLLSFAWNILIIAFFVPYFLIAVGGMGVCIVKLTKMYQARFSRIFEKYDNQGSLYYSILVISIGLAFISFILPFYLAAQFLGNALLFIFFLVGLYFIFKRYKKRKQS
ncbi:hypothetical protein MUA90_00545 [Staphylococcus sp. IVB6181]|uniref:hypothetical protein n=1 Tax=Staphylococcus sp. IVB6181 TaxID=2929481 RepID=UPI0021CEF49C|nr:hypothetical protein [Staphylococcus sp. IVB6181]UXV35075.1 hypothetical protein MUA90_00545 [Staphylococcus sp. IVB6181]